MRLVTVPVVTGLALRCRSSQRCKYPIRPSQYVGYTTWPLTMRWQTLQPATAQTSSSLRRVTVLWCSKRAHRRPMLHSLGSSTRSPTRMVLSMTWPWLHPSHKSTDCTERRTEWTRHGATGTYVSGVRELNVPLASGNFTLDAGSTITMRMFYRSVEDGTYGDVIPMPASASDGEGGTTPGAWSNDCRCTLYIDLQ